MTKFSNEIILQLIQLMLAPAVMINACGLLILGINSKYSIIVNRIRLLNDERRNLINLSKENESQERIKSISEQLIKLAFRVKIVRNVVFCYVSALTLFVLTSILIGFDFLTLSFSLKYFSIVTFLCGMILVLSGALLTSYEIFEGYKIVRFEVESGH